MGAPTGPDPGATHLPDDYSAIPMMIRQLVGLGVPRHQLPPEQLLRGLLPSVETLRSGLTAPRDAFTGALPMVDPETGMPSAEALQRARHFTSTAMTGGLPGGIFAAPKGSAGIFGGRLAKGANLDELEAAKAFAANGGHPEDVWRQTGWFQGADAKWRHEIPDTLAKFAEKPPEHGKLPELLTDHPMLYAAYPELKNALYHVEPGGHSSAYEGMTTNGKHLFTIGEKQLQSDPSVVLHEIQHAIQRKEGFAAGGAPARGPFPSQFDAEVLPLLQERRELQDAWPTDAAGHWIPNGVSPKTRERLSYLDRVAKTHMRLQDAYSAEAFTNYRRLAGETEANAVQARYKGPKLIENVLASNPHLIPPKPSPPTPPWQSEQFPRAEQIPSAKPLGTGPKSVGTGMTPSGGLEPYYERRLQEMPQGFDPFTRKGGLPEAPGATAGSSDVNPAALELRRAGGQADDLHGFAIHNDKGERVGTSLINASDPQHLYVEWMGRNNNFEGANTLGPKEIRSLIGSLKSQYPDALTVRGFRASGSRYGGKSSEEVFHPKGRTIAQMEPLVHLQNERKFALDRSGQPRELTPVYHDPFGAPP